MKVGTRAAAEQVKVTLEAKLKLGELGILEPKTIKPTFKEYADRWLQDHVTVFRKPATVLNYRNVLQSHLVPHFGIWQLDQIDRGAVRGFVAKLVAEGKLGHATIRLILAVLRALCNAAIEDGVVKENPVVRVRKLIPAAGQTFTATPLTVAEAELLLDAAKALSPDFHFLVLMALRTGLRKGELLALKWSDVQLEQTKPFIFVQRNLSAGRVTTPKGNKARRVDISAQLQRALVELKDNKLLAAFTVGRNTVTDDLLFPVGLTELRDRFLRCIERAGLRKVRFHDLRHSFAARLLERGVPMTYVRDQMGHSSIKITADTYGHLIPNPNPEWINAADQETSRQQSATQTQPEEIQPEPERPEVLHRAAHQPDVLNIRLTTTPCNPFRKRLKGDRVFVKEKFCILRWKAPNRVRPLVVEPSSRILPFSSPKMPVWRAFFRRFHPTLCVDRNSA